MSSADPRRRIPRTDTLLALPELRTATSRHGRDRVRAAIIAAQDLARSGSIAPEDVAAHASANLPHGSSSLTPVVNATGVVVHTNIGRAPLSPKAVDAIVDAAGHHDLEFDLDTGERGSRGSAVLRQLREAVPAAEAALVVNNGAAALVLATTTLAAGREVVVSRGELVEIGAGFRLPDLIASTGARLREVGTTNRTHRADYASALSEHTGCILKVHPSNFRVDGFTSAVPIAELAGLTELAVPVVADIGSGLLTAEPRLPDEPDAQSVLTAGADLVTASGDKLLGGPQAGIVLGRADLVERLRRHPLARALRVDKLTLAALEATLTGPPSPVTTSLRLTREDLRPRTARLADALGRRVVEVDGRVGGGGAPGVPLPGLAVELPADCAAALRAGRPAVVARIDGGRCLIDLRCVPPGRDADLEAAARAALESTGTRAPTDPA